MEPATPPEPVSETPPATMLSAQEIRVLGCLIEKEVTTPEYYPLTLNALVNACNQKSNRDPVMQLSEEEAMRALDQLRFTHQLVALVHVSGSRVPKYKHTLTAKYRLSPEEVAILCELFLRGPQTVGELRTRASRLHAFAALNAVEKTLQELAENGEGAMVARLPRESGRRESRYVHLLGGAPEQVVPVESSSESPAGVPGLHERVRTLELEVEALRDEVRQLRANSAAKG